jgi:hypothetical protein
MSVNKIKSVSQAIATVVGKYGTVTVAYAQETDKWRRSFLSSKAAAEFTAAVEKEAKTGALGPDVTTVALVQVQLLLQPARDCQPLTQKFPSETPHESEKDSRTHWTAFAIKNDDLSQGTTRHIV